MVRSPKEVNRRRTRAETYSPIAPVVRNGSAPCSVFKNLMKYPWVLKLQTYNGLRDFEERVLPTILSRVKTVAQQAKARRHP